MKKLLFFLVSFSSLLACQKETLPSRTCQHPLAYGSTKETYPCSDWEGNSIDCFTSKCLFTSYGFYVASSSKANSSIGWTQITIAIGAELFELDVVYPNGVPSCGDDYLPTYQLPSEQ